MTSSPKLRLRYFPFPGRAGAIRDTLRIARIPFEDVQIPPDRFAELKAKGELPFGSMPVLDVATDGSTVTAAQSNAILRYAGRLAGLYPTDEPLRALKVDEAMDVAEDLYHLIGPSIGEQDAARRMAMRKALAEETLPRWGGFLERLLVANGLQAASSLEAAGSPQAASGRTRFVVGDTLTVADLKLHWIVDKLTNGTLDGVPTTVLDGFPALATWRQNVAAERAARLAAAAA